MYGTAEIKKIDTKSIPFDFSLFQKMVDPTFLETLKIEIDDFMSTLLGEHSEGKHLLLFYSSRNPPANLILFPGNSSTLQNKLQIKAIANIKTPDPSIDIALSLEYYSPSELGLRSVDHIRFLNFLYILNGKNVKGQCLHTKRFFIIIATLGKS
jgi:hypothetical protein